MQKTGDLPFVEFSFIIPVYNTSAYLADCVKSALDQDYDRKRCEIILIDDGSTDDSGSLCDRLADQYPMIKVFHQHNQGTAAARNLGLQNASGEYIIFLDSDDRILPNACQSLHEIIEAHHIDIIVTNLCMIDGEHQEKLCHDQGLNNTIVSGRDYLYHELSHHSLHMAMVLQIYRRAFLNENQLRLLSGMRYEDEDFTPRALLATDAVYVSDLCFYQYLIHDASITHQSDYYPKVKDLYTILLQLDELYQKEAEPLRSYLRESLLEKYLYLYAKANAYEKQFDDIRNKAFVKGKAKSMRNRLKVLLFSLSDQLYCHINQKGR